MNWATIGSGNGLSSVWHQAITWTNADLLSIWSLGTNFNEIQINILKLSFVGMHLKMLSVKWWPFCPGEDEFNNAFENHVSNVLVIFPGHSVYWPWVHQYFQQNEYTAGPESPVTFMVIEEFKDELTSVIPIFHSRANIYKDKPLWCWKWNTAGKLDQYHGFWWPGSLRHNVICSHDIEYAVYTGPCLPQESI